MHFLVRRVAPIPTGLCLIAQRLCSIHVVTSHDLAAIKRVGADAKMIVIDEAHHLCAWATSSDKGERQIFERVRSITEAPKQRLLLLSATPVLHNEQGFLAMLHLLDPSVYRMRGVCRQYGLFEFM